MKNGPVFFFSNDGKEFGSSIYQKVSPKLEIGVDLAWFTENNDTKLGIGLKYNLENNAALKAKVDNQSRIGLGYSQTISPGMFSSRFYFLRPLNHYQFSALTLLSCGCVISYFYRSVILTFSDIHLPVAGFCRQSCADV